MIVLPFAALGNVREGVSTFHAVEDVGRHLSIHTGLISSSGYYTFEARNISFVNIAESADQFEGEERFCCWKGGRYGSRRL